MLLNIILPTGNTHQLSLNHVVNSSKCCNPRRYKCAHILPIFSVLSLLCQGWATRNHWQSSGLWSQAGATIVATDITPAPGPHRLTRAQAPALLVTETRGDTLSCSLNRDRPKNLRSWDFTREQCPHGFPSPGHRNEKWDSTLIIFINYGPVLSTSTSLNNFKMSQQLSALSRQQYSVS